MPIIILWNLTVAGSLPQFRRWFDSFERSSFLLERWFERRMRYAEDLDRTTMRFPVFRFYNEAVTARLVDSQKGLLLTEPVPSVGSHLERALGQWNVPARVRRSRRESRLLPELFRVLEEITAGVKSSIDRFETPFPEMFDPRRRSARDLPGLALLAYKAFATSGEQTLGAARNVKRALTGPVPAPPEVALPGAPPAPTFMDEPRAMLAPYEARIDELTRYVVAGILIVPALAGLIGTMGNDALLFVRWTALEFFERMERKAFAFRRRVLMVFVRDVPSYARQGLLLLEVAREWAIGHLRFYARVGIEYMRSLIGGVTTFAEQLADYWSKVTGVIRKVLAYGQAIIDMDVGPVLHKALVAIKDAIETIADLLYADDDDPPQMYTPPPVFAVTVRELILNEGAGTRAHRELLVGGELLRRAWNNSSITRRVIGGVAVETFAGYNIPGLIRGVIGLGALSVLPRRDYDALAAAQPTLTFDTSTLPDLNARIIEPFARDLTAAVEGGIGGVSTAIGGVVGSVVTLLDGTAETFDRAAVEASWLGSRNLLNELVGDVDGLMVSLFPEQPAGPEPTGLQPLAGAYAQWLVQGGFDTIGGVMAGFLSFVLDEWATHLAENRDTPVEITETSPRKLRERAVLGRVHTRELRIVARGQEVGRPLAARLAERFRGAVQEAYAEGQERLAALAALPEAATP